MFPQKTKEAIARQETAQIVLQCGLQMAGHIRRGKERYRGTIQITLMRLACSNRKLRPVCCYTRDSDRCHSDWHIVVRSIKTTQASVCKMRLSTVYF